MACPPSKRLRGFHSRIPVDRDSFGDDDDFTQDDLEEIDIIASQAIIQDAQPTHIKRPFDSICGHPTDTNNVKEGRKTFAIGNNHSTHSSSSSSSTGNNTSPKRLGSFSKQTLTDIVNNLTYFMHICTHLVITH